ncbi:MAG: PAS domain S-box protein, partial [Bacteroidota bacterium]
MVWKDHISILLVEDNQDDIELLRLVLDRSKLKYSITTASSREEFEGKISKPFDLIISDFNLINFNGLEVIQEIRRLDVLVPILILSGTVGEELAVSLLREGANDFILKSNLSKIIIAIERALQESKMKREKLLFGKELEEKTHILNSIFNSFTNIIFLKDAEGNYLKVNKAFCDLVEMSEEDIIGKDDSKIFPKHLSSIGKEKDELVILTGRPISYEMEFLNSNGKQVILELTKTPISTDGLINGIIGECKNITKGKLLYDDVRRARAILDHAERLSESGSFEYDSELDILICSLNFKQMLGLSIESTSISLRKFTNLIKKEERELFSKEIYKAIDNRTEYLHEHRLEVKSGKTKILHINVSLRPDYKDKNSRRFYGTIINVTDEYETHILNLQKHEDDRK